MKPPPEHCENFTTTKPRFTTPRYQFNHNIYIREVSRITCKAKAFAISLFSLIRNPENSKIENRTDRVIQLELGADLGHLVALPRHLLDLHVAPVDEGDDVSVLKFPKNVHKI